MEDVVSRRPVQSYSREAERISAEIGQPNSDPRLVDDLVSAIKVQADEVSNFFIGRSTHPQRLQGMKRQTKK